MSAPTISPITKPRASATVENKTDQIAFVSEWESFSADISDVTVEEMNELGEYLDELAVTIDETATTAIQATDVALTAANFKGNFNIGTSYTVPSSVLHLGTYYMAIAPSTGQTPPNVTYWSPIYGIDDDIISTDTTYSSYKIDSEITLLSPLDVINTSNPSVELISSKRRSAWTFGISGTGAIQIELVGLYPYSLDGRMTVRIKETLQNAFKLDIDGRWDAGDTWAAYNATGDKEINVRFAKDASKTYILIGDTSTVWGNTRIEIDDILSNYNASLSLGFNLSLVSSYPTTVIGTVAVVPNGGTFAKPFQGAPLFTKNSVSTITIPIGTSVKVGANVITVSGSAYTLSLNTTGVGALDTGAKAAGTDYYVYALEAGGFILSANGTNPSGYTTANSRKIGGFHYGVIPEAFTAINNITSSDATKIAGINAYSFWDLKFRPICDPKGMVYILGRWYDIYLLNTDHHTYGTSAAGKTIAGGAVLNGRNFPKIPLFYGGNGTVTYGTLTWFEACEIGKAYSKELISYEEFVAIAYGVLEATSAGASDTGVTQHLANFTSKFGLCMATGCQFIWSKDTTAIVTSTAWSAVTEGRGSVYSNSNGVYSAVLGGHRAITVESGSRCSNWDTSLWYTSWAYGCRFACSHLELA